MESAQIERARKRHNGLVDELARLNRRLDKLDEQRMRAVSKKKKLISSVSRSSKRIDKLMALKTHTAGPTASVSRRLVKANLTKATVGPEPPIPINDPVPDFKPEQKPLGVPMLPKGRRTPDDFRADMAKKKARQQGADGLGKS